jgi:hypothetical protein
MKRKILIILLLPLLAIAGCKTTLMVTNQSDPKSFRGMPFLGSSDTKYEELVIEVPEEVSSEEFDIEDTSLFADAYVDYLWIGPGETVDVTVEIYLGLESGEANLGDDTKNELLTSFEISDISSRYPLRFDDPRLINIAIRQDKFFIKARVNVVSSGVVAGTVKIDDVYFITHLSRDIEGLGSFFYLF